MGCATLKNEPLDKLNFKDNKWKIVYTEDNNLNDDIDTCSIGIINDNKIIQSLKKEYKCDLKKQSDGEQAYGIYIFKDNYFYSWHLFNEKKYVSLGKLKSNLVRVKTSYINCTNSNDMKTITDSLAKNGFMYTISPIDPWYKSLDEFSVKLELGINTKSKLIAEEDKYLYGWVRVAQRELKKLYPELTIKDPSENQFNEDELEVDAPGYMYQENENGRINQFTAKSILCSDKYFKFDKSRLKNSDLFLNYYICPKYIITIYEKR